MEEKEEHAKLIIKKILHRKAIAEDALDKALKEYEVVLQMTADEIFVDLR